MFMKLDAVLLAVEKYRRVDMSKMMLVIPGNHIVILSGSIYTIIWMF